jgi:hypothetical protein
MNYAQMKMRLLKVWLQPQSLFERGLRVGKLISLRQDRSRKSARSLASSTARFISDRASSPGRWLKIFANMRWASAFPGAILIPLVPPARPRRPLLAAIRTPAKVSPGSTKSWLGFNRGSKVRHRRFRFALLGENPPSADCASASLGASRTAF